MNIELIQDALNAALQEIERHALDTDSGDRAHELVDAALEEIKNATNKSGTCSNSCGNGCGGCNRHS